MLILSACSKGENSTTTEQTDVLEEITISFTNPETEQSFKIIRAYQLYKNYMERLRVNREETPENALKEEVMDPLYDACFSDGVNIHMLEDFLNTAPERLQVQAALQLMANREIEGPIEEALIKSASLLPTEMETTVCVFPSTDVGESMITVGPGKIVVLYNRFFDENILKAGIAHEYHHSAWMEKYNSGALPSTVLEYLIYEGKAVMFEKEVFPNIDVTNIDPTFDQELWSQVEPYLDSNDREKILEIIYGGDSLPKDYGLSEGYKIVQAYLETEPNATVDEWSAISPQEIFENGNYLENDQ